MRAATWTLCGLLSRPSRRGGALGRGGSWLLVLQPSVSTGHSPARSGDRLVPSVPCGALAAELRLVVGGRLRERQIPPFRGLGSFVLLVIPLQPVPVGVDSIARRTGRTTSKSRRLAHRQGHIGPDAIRHSAADPGLIPNPLFPFASGSSAFNSICAARRCRPCLSVLRRVPTTVTSSSRSPRCLNERA